MAASRRHASACRRSISGSSAETLLRWNTGGLIPARDGHAQWFLERVFSAGTRSAPHVDNRRTWRRTDNLTCGRIHIADSRIRSLDIHIRRRK